MISSTLRKIIMKQLFPVIDLEEGFREKPYLCSEGYPTYGYGKKIGKKGESLDKYAHMSITKAEAFNLFSDFANNIIDSLSTKDWFVKQDVDRQVILISMCYQMGVSKVGKFKNMIDGLSVGDYAKAEREALDSRWARQTPKRAHRHAKVLRTGNLAEFYKI